MSRQAPRLRLAIALVLLAISRIARAATPEPYAREPSPLIDVRFVVDTTLLPLPGIGVGVGGAWGSVAVLALT